jgi:hypothetical protein
MVPVAVVVLSRFSFEIVEARYYTVTVFPMSKVA